MSWARIDDGMWSHPKVIAAGTAAMGLWVKGLAYSAQHLTDGRLDVGAILVLVAGDELGRVVGDELGAQRGASKGELRRGALELQRTASIRLAERLVKVGLWVELPDGGYVIHDYLSYNLSKAQVISARARDAARHKTSRGTPDGLRQDSVMCHAGHRDGILGSNKPAKATRSRAGSDPSFSDPEEHVAFQEFWAAYPRKRSLGAALKAWVKIPSPRPVAAMLAALGWQRELPEWRKDGGQYVPYPATWLSARGWEDEPAEAGGAAAVDGKTARTFAGLAALAEEGAPARGAAYPWMPARLEGSK